MTTAESHVHFRLRELHSLFLSEFERCAHDNAVALLKQIGKEARSAPAAPDIPTATVDGRLSYLRHYERARGHKLYDRVLELMECMRLEDSKRT
jgi:hypothetical protein